MLGSEGLKGVGVATIGQRLAILKAVYNIKLAHNVSIEPDHYVPPCEHIQCLGTKFGAHSLDS
jgi:protein STE50